MPVLLYPFFRPPGYSTLPGTAEPREELSGPSRAAQRKSAAGGRRREELLGNSGTADGGCDQTGTNAPDPVRTPKLKVLGRE